MNDFPHNAIAIVRQERSVLESLSANILYLALDEIRRDGGRSREQL